MNNFREWLSDNLRYILLILVIVAVLIALFFGVRSVSRSSSGDNASAEPSAKSAAASSPGASAAQTASGTSAASGAQAEHGELTEETSGDIFTLINSYYAAVSSQNADAVKELSDTLPTAEAEKIRDSDLVYSNVKVYTKNGYDADSRIVYASYEYLGTNQPAKYPGLSQMYVRKDADGAWKIIFGDLTSAESAYITAVGQDEDVQALITQVQDEYKEALSASGSAASGAESVSPSAAAGTDSESSSGAESASASSGSGASENESSEGNSSGESEEQEAEESESEAAEESTPTPTPTPTETPTPTPTPYVPTYRDTEILSDCYVRSGPGYEYDVISEVSAGTTVTVIDGIDNGWWHVYADGVYGYVGKPFIN